MTELIVFALHALALTYVVTESALLTFPRMTIRRVLVSIHSALFDTKVRVIGRAAAVVAFAMYCRPCVGFWIGFMLGKIGHAPLPPIESALVACGFMVLMNRYLGDNAAFDYEGDLLRDPDESWKDPFEQFQNGDSSDVTAPEIQDE